MSGDLIIIKGLEVFAHHGVLPQEKRDGQSFYLDLELSVDLAKASRSDALCDTVDYDEVCRAAGEAMTRRGFDLIERAAGEVCDVILERFSLVDSVAVTLRKPQAPVCMKIEHAAVRMSRSRNKARD